MTSPHETNVMAAADGKTPAPIDHAYLSRYTMGNAELEKEVLNLFAGQAPEYLKQIHEAQTDKEWRDAAHTLKGSARAVGALDVAKCAERAEAAARSGDRAERQKAIVEAERALEIACAYIRGLPTGN